MAFLPGRSLVSRKSIVAALLVGSLLALCSFAMVGAQEAEEPAPAPAGDGPPLPLHTIEGVGGIVLTPMAYLVNPGPPGTMIGKPSVAAHMALVGNKDLEAFSITETLFGRLELGYAVNRLGLADFPDDVQAATGIDIGTHDVWLHHLNARLNVIRENEWDTTWVPAVTIGAHYKHNADIDDIDRRLGGALTGLGLDDNNGVDFTLTATKAVNLLSRPTFVTAGARASKAAQLGLVGFTDDYSLTFEGSVLMLVTGQLGIGAEYRQKPDDMGQIPGVIGGEDDWWDVHAAYVFNNNAVGYFTVGRAGTVLNHSGETLIGTVFKYEF